MILFGIGLSSLSRLTFLFFAPFPRLVTQQNRPATLRSTMHHTALHYAPHLATTAHNTSLQVHSVTRAHTQNFDEYHPRTAEHPRFLPHTLYSRREIVVAMLEMTMTTVRPALLCNFSLQFTIYRRKSRRRRVFAHC
jgi:hypothetical protein